MCKSRYLASSELLPRNHPQAASPRRSDGNLIFFAPRADNAERSAQTFLRSRDEKSALWRLRLGLKSRQERDQRRKWVVGQEPRVLAPRNPLAPGIF